MRMSRRAGLLGGGSGRTYNVTITADRQTGGYCYVTIGGVDYQAAAVGQTWRLTVPEGTAATGCIVNNVVGETRYIYYLGRMVTSTSSKQITATYDFVVDRDLAINYGTDSNLRILED